jgi:protease-4
MTASFALLAVVLVISFVAAMFAFAQDGIERALPPRFSVVYGSPDAKHKLLALPVTGIILGERSEFSDPFNLLTTQVTYGYELKRQLIEAAEDNSIKGIVLEINSPGGTIYGARAIADGVEYYRKQTKKPVIAHISGLGTSGGYWVASSAEEIFADYGSTLGSIGVLFGPFKYYNTVISEDQGALVGGVVTQNGIETTYFTAGTSKDIGNPYRRLTAEEIDFLQRSVNNEYNDFVEFVSKHRNISSTTIKEKIGALIYENKSALELRLIDGTRNKQEAYAILAKKAGLTEGAYYVVQHKTEPPLRQFLFSALLNDIKPKSVCLPYLSSLILAYQGDIFSLCQ